MAKRGPGSRHMRWPIALVVLSAVTVLMVLGHRWAVRSWPPLPPLLREARGRGGYGHACPQARDPIPVENRRDLAVSPEMEERLHRRFPAGTPERVLVQALVEQGFKSMPPCRDDPSVRSAEYFRQAAGLHIFACWGRVFWKVDNDQLILWTHGFVSYVP